MSKNGLIISITVVSTIVMCALVNMLATYEVKEVIETTEPKQVIIQNNYTNEKNTHNDYYENKRINELEEQIKELKENQSESEETTIIKEESVQSVQQISNDNMEPNIVTCDHCGRQGELYENIARWYSTDGNNNFTHAYCIKKYIEVTGKEPAQNIPNLK